MSDSTHGPVTRRAALRASAGIGLSAAALGTPPPAAAQSATPAAGVASVPTLTVAGAMAVLQAAWQVARRLGVPEVIAVVDAAGNLKAFVRMDNTPNTSIDLAMDKAFTAASFSTPTDQFAKAVSGDAATMASILKAPHITLLPGGVPLQSGHAVIGAIGCSGGSGAQDQQCAQAGVAALPA